MTEVSVTMPSDVEIEMTRIFDAPVELVWAAFTQAEHLQRWNLGPDGWTMPVCEFDLRVGGIWRCVWRSTEHESQFEIGGEILEIEAPNRLVQTEGLDDGPKGVTTLVLSEHEGRTLMTSTLRFPTKELRDQVYETGMADGAALSYDRLDHVLPSLTR